jgi:hypothetical protein
MGNGLDRWGPVDLNYELLEAAATRLSRRDSTPQGTADRPPRQSHTEGQDKGEYKACNYPRSLLHRCTSQL